MKKTQVSDFSICKKSIVFLLGIIMISCLFIFKDFLFGNQVLAYTDIGSDTYDQYLMHYQSIINHIRDGNFSLWDFNNGYGVNMFTYNLFDPFLLVLYLVGILLGTEQIYGFLVYWMIFHILLAGVAAYLYLSSVSLSERAKVLAAYIYALCGYMVVWGQHYQFGTVIVLFPLLLLAVEHSFRNYKWYLGISIFCAIASLSSLYMAYMQFVALGFYVLFRVAWRENLFSLKGIKRVWKIYGSMILGIGIGFVQLLPSAHLILNVSGRVGGAPLMDRIFAAIELYSVEYYKAFGKHLFSSNMNGSNLYNGYTNFYEDPNIFLSALLLIAIVQFIYLYRKERHTKKEYVVLGLAGTAIFFMVFIPLGSMIFNGFAYPFSRHIFLCMPWAAWLIAYVLHKMLEEKKYSMPLLVASVLGIVVCYLYFFVFADKLIALLLGILAFGMGAALVGYLILQQRIMQILSLLLLTGCVMMSMTGDAYIAYAYGRATLEKKNSPYFAELYDEDITKALEYIESIDDSFYRVEKDYTIGTEFSCLNALAQNYRGVSTYNSTLNTNIAAFCKNVWPDIQVVNEAHSSFANGAGNVLPAALSNIKYVLSKNENYSIEGYTLLKQFGDLYVYENTYTKDFGKFFPHIIDMDIYQNMNISGDAANLLSEYLLCDSMPELTVTQEEVISYKNAQVSEGTLFDLSNRSEGISFKNPKKDSLVAGTAQVMEKGILMLPIPYESGWHAYVDGKEQYIHNVDFGFCGVVLDEGTHEIELRFECPGAKEGVVCSAVFFGITVLIWCMILRCKRDR